MNIGDTMVSRSIRFSFGGVFILIAFLMLMITALGSTPVLNIAFIMNFGSLGLVFGFLGFFLIATALFEE